VLWTTASFQDCLTQEESHQAAQASKDNSPRMIFSPLVNARNNTACAVQMLYVYRDALTAIATLFIALFTLTLWRSTHKLWEESKTAGITANTTANAAMKSVNAMIASERAYIFVEFILDEVLRSSPSGFPNIFRIKLWNNGKTPAEIVMIRAYAVIRLGVPEAIIEIDGRDRELPPGLGIAKDCSFEVPVTCTMTHTELGEIERWEKKLYCVGRISYRDIFGNPHDTGFCWEVLYHMNNARFVPSRDSLLNKRT